MSKLAVIYWTGTGNTGAMAQAVADGAKSAGAEAELLTVSDRSVTDVAIEAGFSTASYLILCFRRQYGMTPARFHALYGFKRGET